MEINGHTRMAAVLAYPIKHSFSPFIHNRAFELVNENGVYLAWELKDEKYLGQMVDNIRTLDMYGLNLSMPYKHKILEFLDELSEEARLIGAVNTVVNHGGKLVGYNTDGIGFFNALAFKPEGKKMILLGGGGAALAIIAQALLLGMREIIVFARRSDSYEPLARRLEKLAAQTQSRLKLFDLSDTPRMQYEITETDLLVNATPVGMLDKAMPISPTIVLPPHLLVVDTIYKTQETPLMKWAEEQGVQTKNGLGMLLHQAAVSFELWTGKKMPVEQIGQDLEAKYEIKG